MKNLRHLIVAGVVLTLGAPALAITDKEKREMVMMTSGDKVVHTYMGRKVTITGAKKLAAAIKKVYLGGSPPAPTLVKSVRGRGVAKP